MESISHIDFPLMENNYPDDDYAVLPTFDLLNETDEFLRRSELNKVNREENHRLAHNETAGIVGESSYAESANIIQSISPSVYGSGSAERPVLSSTEKITISNQDEDMSSENESDDESSESNSDTGSSVVFLGTKPSATLQTSVVWIDDSGFSTISEAVEDSNNVHTNYYGERSSVTLSTRAQTSTETDASSVGNHENITFYGEPHPRNFPFGGNRYEMARLVQLTTDLHKQQEEEEHSVRIGDNNYENDFVNALANDMQSDPRSATRIKEVLRNIMIHKRVIKQEDDRSNESDRQSKKTKMN